MTTSNINKIVQSNINLKPWMLSKNTSQLVNTYIEKIYKQIPTGFNKNIKVAKVASARTENVAPLRSLKNQEKQLAFVNILPQNTSKKKSITKVSRTNNSHQNTLKISNQNNPQITAKLAGTNLLPSKRLLKSPNYKIYKSRRFGSSASSSRSSLFRYHDERKRQKQNISHAQINYLIRSFHTSQFEPTYARYLMPARNQQLENTLGSITDAIRFSSNIKNDLMPIDNLSKVKSDRDKSKLNVKQPKRNCLDAWNHPPSLSKFRIYNTRESAIKHISSTAEHHMRRTRLSPEHRDYTRINVSRTSQMKHIKTPNELFTAQHDRNNTELHEKHRRNRMKKLGLVESTKDSDANLEDLKVISKLPSYKPQRPEKQNDLGENLCQPIDQAPKSTKCLPRVVNQVESKVPPKYQSNIPPYVFKDARNPPKYANLGTTHTDNRTIVNNPKPNPDNLITSPEVSSSSSMALPKTYSITSPSAAARAQMPNRNSYRAYRFKPTDIFGINKY